MKKKIRIRRRSQLLIDQRKSRSQQPSTLRIYSERDMTQLELSTANQEKLVTVLSGIQASYQKFTDLDLGVFSQYIENNQLDALSQATGFRHIIGQSPKPDHLDSEHTSSEDMAVLVLSGKLMLGIHVEGKVYELSCTSGDLISLPAELPRWIKASSSQAPQLLWLGNDEVDPTLHTTGNIISRLFNSPAA